MSSNRLRVLFICTGNSARSQMAEALLRKMSDGVVDVYSAGTQPHAEVHPVALGVLRDLFHIDTSELHPKHLDQFSKERFDYVITVCDRARERCPFFPGDPKRIHWSFEDPSTIEGTKAQRRAFKDTANGLAARLRVWMAYAMDGKNSRVPQKALFAPSKLVAHDKAIDVRTASSGMFRTVPPADAPIVMIVYFGAMRRCTNMCTFLERSGFQVFCGDIYGREPETIGLIPDVVLVRSDARRGGDVRLEFDALLGIRQALRRTPIVIALPSPPSVEETDCAEEVGAKIVHSQGVAYTQLIVKTLSDLVNQRRS